MDGTHRLPCPSLSPELLQTCVHRVGDAIQLSHPLSSFLLPPSPSSTIRIFSSELVLCIRWPKYWSLSLIISPFSEYLGLISLGWTGWISLQSKGLSRVFSTTTVPKHQFFSAHLSLWSNSHIHTRLPEKPQLWLDGPLSAEGCVCF